MKHLYVIFQSDPFSFIKSTNLMKTVIKHFKNRVYSLPYYSNIQKEGIIIASKEEAQKQFDNAESIVAAIIEYMRKNNSGTII